MPAPGGTGARTLSGVKQDLAFSAPAPPVLVVPIRRCCHGQGIPRAAREIVLSAGYTGAGESRVAARATLATPTPARLSRG